ncbi:MAG TPA: AAA family ATPase [Oculatellaceae cyanobacterium]|jgi:predicted ATP-dependent endonuclease of OLD family
MKLASVLINRFRSIKNVELENVGDFNVLIGKNNSGKSNILSAINTFFDCIKNGNLIDLNPCIGQETKIKEIHFFEKETKLPIEITLAFILSPRDREDLIKNIIAEAPQVKNAVGSINPALQLVASITGEENSIPNYAKNLIAKVSSFKVLHLRERREPIGEEEAQKLLSLKVKRGGEEALRNIKETVYSLLGVSIDAFQGESTSNEAAELDVDNFLIEVNGSGIRESLRLVLDVEFGEPNILLVEEPEIHLHPALETSMMRYLKRISANCQVFLTTHSTNFLDTAEMQNVYLISKPSSTQIQKLNVEEAEAKIPK